MSAFPDTTADRFKSDQTNNRNDEAELPPGLARILNGLLATISARNAALVIGPAGAGKTTLLRLLEADLRLHGIAVAMVTPTDPLPGRATVLLMDNAHLLDPDTWQQVTRRSVPYILAGLPSLLDRKPAGKLKLITVPLSPMPAAETALYVRAMLRDMGKAPALVPPTSIRALSEASGGLPGRAAAIMRMAIYLAQLEGAGAIELHHVARASMLETDEAELQELPHTTEWAPEPISVTKVSRKAVLLAAATGLAAVLLLPIITAPELRPPAPVSAPVPTPVSVPPPEPVTAPPPAPSAAATNAPTVFVKVANKPSASPAAGPPPALPMPTAPRLHVAMLISPDDSGAKPVATAMAVMLRTQGYAVTDPAPSPMHTAGLEVRYFFTEDSEAAGSLARIIGASPTAVHLADVEPHKRLRPGTAEILAGSGSRSDR